MPKVALLIEIPRHQRRHFTGGGSNFMRWSIPSFCDGSKT
jgi:hypothetical protein